MVENCVVFSNLAITTKLGAVGGILSLIHRFRPCLWNREIKRVIYNQQWITFLPNEKEKVSSFHLSQVLSHYLCAGICLISFFYNTCSPSSLPLCDLLPLSERLSFFSSQLSTWLQFFNLNTIYCWVLNEVHLSFADSDLGWAFIFDQKKNTEQSQGRNSQMNKIPTCTFKLGSG